MIQIQNISVIAGNPIVPRHSKSLYQHRNVQHGLVLTPDYILIASLISNENFGEREQTGEELEISFYSRK